MGQLQRQEEEDSFFAGILPCPYPLQTHTLDLFPNALSSLNS
jgi:hypothetical protein